MRIIQATAYSILCLLYISCNNNAQTNSPTTGISSTDSISTKGLDSGNPIDFETTKVIRSTYITDRNGADMRQSANKDAKRLGSYSFGTKLDVIEETDEWLGVRDRITRESIENGTDVETTQWEKVYVLKKQTGPMTEIGLLPADLNIITYLTENDKTESYEKGKPLNEYIKLEIIDEALYNSKKKSAVNFLLADTTVVKKKNGIIELKSEHKTARYVDKPEAEEDMQIFQYLGQVDFLHQYLITGSYWESLDYRFIDKTTGEETTTFGEYPHISADKKHIISIYANPYEQTADLSLYTITNSNKIDDVIHTSFKNWMPSDESTQLFWSRDGYFYAAVNHINSYWKPDGSLNDKFQYIRIKVL